MGMFKSAGFAGTWGPGLNRMGNLHVKDCTNAILTVFKAALEGKAEEGREGFCMSLYYTTHLWFHLTTLRFRCE